MDDILKDLKPEVIERVEQEILAKQLQVKPTESIRIGRITKPPKRRVPVRLRRTDHLGPAPYPEGYIQQQKSQPVQPRSFQEARRLAKDSIVITKAPVLRAAGGEVWKDESMSLWAENDYRLFVGDLGKEVSDELLTRAFAQYPSLLRVHVVKDNKSGKSKGYGFVSFASSDDYIKAMREMNGKYVGSRPISLKRSTWKDRVAVPENIEKQKELAAIAKKPIQEINN